MHIAIYNIIPVDDSEEHTENGDCSCVPEVKKVMVGGSCAGVLVIHNAFDGRLAVEWANEILKDKQ